jgi:hypothetical protein
VDKLERKKLRLQKLRDEVEELEQQVEDLRKAENPATDQLQQVEIENDYMNGFDGMNGIHEKRPTNQFVNFRWFQSGYNVGLRLNHGQFDVAYNNYTNLIKRKCEFDGFTNLFESTIDISFVDPDLAHESLTAKQDLREKHTNLRNKIIGHNSKIYQLKRETEK